MDTGIKLEPVIKLQIYMYRTIYENYRTIYKIYGSMGGGQDINKDITMIVATFRENVHHHMTVFFNRDDA